MTLSKVLEVQRQRIVEESFGALTRWHLPHYPVSEPELVRDRLERLYDLAVDAIERRNLETFLEYAAALARERYYAGVSLAEVQTAFNVLEEAIWRCALETIPPGELAEALGLVGTVLGAGKDHLARTYVSLASSCHVPALNMLSLFAGT